MAQFDVYKNPNTRTRKIYPYLVSVQNDLLDDLNSIVVVPLGKFNDFKHEQIHHLTLLVSFDAVEYLLLTPQLAAVRKDRLKQPIGTIKSLRDEIVAALDLLVTGI